MRSTGEVAALGSEFEDALLKSWLSVKPNRMPEGSVLIYGWKDGEKLNEAARILESVGYNVLSIEGTLNFGEPIGKKRAVEMLKNGGIDLVMTSGYARGRDYWIRRTAVDMNVPIVLDANLAYKLSKAFKLAEKNEFEVRSLGSTTIKNLNLLNN